MAVVGGPNIVADGLVLYLDAANTESYTGSGTTWTDLSGNGINAILTNSPTYSSSDNGSFFLDGVDDFVDLRQKAGLNLNNFSYMCWYKPTQFSASFDTIFSREDARHYIGFQDSGQYGIFLRGSLWATNGAFEGTIGDTGVVQLNSWQNIAIVINWSTSTFYAYHNANLIWSLNNTLLGDSFILVNDNSAVIGSRYSGSTSNKMIGNVSNFLYYNKPLSAAEILQNYNALKSRYGL